MNWSKRALDGILLVGAVFIALDYLLSWERGNILNILGRDILLILVVIGPLALIWLYLGRPEKL
jgi:hypothetical protein